MKNLTYIFLKESKDCKESAQINYIDELRFDVNNGIILCGECYRTENAYNIYEYKNTIK